MSTHTDTAAFDELVPDPQVCKELSISLMSVWRWDRNPELIALGWPPPIYINKRKYRSRQQFEQFKRAVKTRADKPIGVHPTEKAAADALGARTAS